jgi:hypothetical protein
VVVPLIGYKIMATYTVTYNNISSTAVSPHVQRMAKIRQILERMDGSEAQRKRIQAYMQKEYLRDHGYTVSSGTWTGTSTYSTKYYTSTRTW